MAQCAMGVDRLQSPTMSKAIEIDMPESLTFDERNLYRCMAIILSNLPNVHVQHINLTTIERCLPQYFLQVLSFK